MTKLKKNAKPVPANLRRVAVFMIDLHMGDFILALPTIAALARYFEHGIDLYVAKQHVPLAELLPDIGKIVPYEHSRKDRRSAKQLMNYLGMFFRLPFRFYQAAFFIRPRITESSFSVLTFAPQRITTSSARRKAAYSWIIQENPAERHEAHKMASILEAIGHSTAIEPLKLHAGDADRKYMETILHTNGVEPGGKLAVIHPSSGIPQKSWPHDRFAYVADALVECGMKVAFIAAPHEKELVDDIRGQMQHPEGSFYFAHKLTVLLALFERATLLFSNESGPTHLAATTDLPIVTIFGPTDPGAWKPVREENLTLLSKKEQCKCSDVRYCDLGWPCIRGITVEEALHALEECI